MGILNSEKAVKAKRLSEINGALIKMKAEGTGASVGLWSYVSAANHKGSVSGYFITHRPDLAKANQPPPVQVVFVRPDKTVFNATAVPNERPDSRWRKVQQFDVNLKLRMEILADRVSPAKVVFDTSPGITGAKRKLLKEIDFGGTKRYFEFDPMLAADPSWKEISKPAAAERIFSGVSVNSLDEIESLQLKTIHQDLPPKQIDALISHAKDARAFGEIKGGLSHVCRGPLGKIACLGASATSLAIQYTGTQNLLKINETDPSQQKGAVPGSPTKSAAEIDSQSFSDSNMQEITLKSQLEIDAVSEILKSLGDQSELIDCSQVPAPNLPEPANSEN